MAIPNILKRTPLYDEHVGLGARMVDFGGWEMPVQYEGILNEHKHTREDCTLFDISHMGEFRIKGDAKKSGLDNIVTMSIVDTPVHSCRYGAILNNNGGVIDDLIVFREDQEQWFIVVNGATTEKDAAHFQKHLTGDSSFEDVSAKIGKIDIQGPRSRNILKQFAAGIEKLDFYHFNFFELRGNNVLISRTGYTGELGYEIYYPWDQTKDLWKILLKGNNVKPAGLGARDVLRLEVGYSLYGHELNEETSPLESGLKRFVDFEKEFIGKDALVKEERDGLLKKITGIKSSSRRAPREGHKIYSKEGREMGVITSGTFSPMLNLGIGLGLVEISSAEMNKVIFFGNDRQRQEGVISSRIFYKGGSLKD